MGLHISRLVKNEGVKKSSKIIDIVRNALKMVTCVCSLFLVRKHISTGLYVFTGVQGFTQDKIIASHTCFRGHMDVNC